MKNHHPDLLTSRLRLRLPRLSDAVVLARLANVEYIAIMSRLPYPYRKKDAISWVNEALKKRLSVGIVYYVIEEKESKIVMGTVSAVVQQGIWTAEMGYWLGEKYWGKGYATEAATRINQYLFDVFHLKRIYSNVAVENKASQRVLSKIGMKQERVKLADRDQCGREMDVYLYAIEKN